MRFTYYYKTSDNVRHEAEIDAPSRDEAFAVLRDQGIRPIKMVEDEEWRSENGKRRRFKPVIWIACALAIVASALISFYILHSPFSIFHSSFSIHQVMTPQGPVTYSVAQPLPRQMIPGDRERIENGKLRVENDGSKGGTGVFRFAAEAYLAQYAEPGRLAGAKGEGDVRQPSRVSQLSRMSREAREAEFRDCLKEPIRIASTDFTEVVDLKRIVTGMKLEMRAYLAGGGTVEQYLAELEKRQRLEISYRDNAQRRLDDMIKGIYSPTAKTESGTRNPKTETRNPKTETRNPKPETRNPKPETRNPEPGTRDDQDSKLREAYSYWLKANARLQAMGIYPLPLPDALRSYQMGLDIEE